MKRQNTEYKTKNKEQRAKNKEQRAKSKEQRTKNKEQRAKNKDKRARIKTVFALCSCFLVLLFISLHPLAFSSEGKWSGVDESVVEKYAEEHGRPAREPLINTDQGDLLLFAFLIGGIIGGFTAGYCWRMLSVEQRAKNKEQRTKSKEQRTKIKEQRTKSKEQR